MNGTLELNLNGSKVTVIGGPYLDKPRELRGVKLAEEIDAPYDLKLDIPDFSVPDREETFEVTLRAIDLLVQEGTIYVGCMGGIGRTGLFMALLVKATGYFNLEDQSTGWRGIWNCLLEACHLDSPRKRCIDMVKYPVEFVRANYLKNAVETNEQKKFVESFEWMNFDVNKIKF